MYKCAWRKTEKQVGDDVYIIENNRGILCPCCSKECFENLRHTEIGRLESRIDKLRDLEPRKEKW